MSTMVEENAIAHCDRFLEALQSWRMRPELAAATGSRSATCHVLDAKYEPGVRAVILYSIGDQLVRGDLLPLPDGVRLSPFPHDPDLPSLQQLMDPTTVGPLVGGTGRTRVELLRYRPGKRATVWLTSGDTSVVTKAYHNRTKAAAVAEESVALADAARRRLNPAVRAHRRAPRRPRVGRPASRARITAGCPGRQHPAQPE